MPRAWHLWSQGRDGTKRMGKSFFYSSSRWLRLRFALV